MSTLSLSCSLPIHILFKVFLLSDFMREGGTFIHLDLMSCILELILSISSLVGSLLLSWITDEEKGLRDFLVRRLSLVLAGLILILLFF